MKILKKWRSHCIGKQQRCYENFQRKISKNDKHQREFDRNNINYGKNKTRNFKGTFIRYSFNKLSSGKKNMEFKFIVGLCGLSEYSVHCQTVIQNYRPLK